MENHKIKKNGAVKPFLACLVLLLTVSVAAGRTVYVAGVDGDIDAGTQQYLERVLAEAEEKGADLVVINLNTRAGLVKPAKSIVGNVIDSRTKVAVYAYKKFSGVFSTGVYVLMASDEAAADPQASIGSARPQSGVNATVSEYADYIAKIAEKRGRDTVLARTLVVDDTYMDGKTALKKGLVGYAPESLQDLLNQLNMSGASVSVIEASPFDRMLSAFSNPELVSLFFLAGCLSSVYIIRTRSFLFIAVPLVAFIVCLWGLQNMEFSYLGIGLIILGVVLLYLESINTRPTIFGILGAVSVVAGILTSDAEPFYTPAPETTFAIIFISLVLAAASVLVANRIGRMEMEEAKASAEALIGRKGRVVEELRPNGYVKIEGRLRPAYSVSGEKISMGRIVEVVKVEGKFIDVVPEGWKPGEGGHGAHGGGHNGHETGHGEHADAGHEDRGHSHGGKDKASHH